METWKFINEKESALRLESPEIVVVREDAPRVRPPFIDVNIDI